MKLWAILARYAYRSGEFQVRFPLGDAGRAALALDRVRMRFGVRAGRVEKGSAVWGGRSALAVLEALETPPEMVRAARDLVETGAPQHWRRFCRKLADQLYLLVHLRPR